MGSACALTDAISPLNLVLYVFILPDVKVCRISVRRLSKKTGVVVPTAWGGGTGPEGRYGNSEVELMFTVGVTFCSIGAFRCLYLIAAGQFL